MMCAPTCCNARHTRGGFTLVELLVASVLLSVVMASVYTLFYAVLVPWRAVEQDYDAYRETRNAMSLIEREVHNLAPAAAHLLEGEDDEVTMFLVSEPMDVEKSEGRHLLRVRYRFNSASGELIREEALVTSPLPNAAPPGGKVDHTRMKVKQKRDFVVATHVDDFAVRYVWLPAPQPRNADVPPTMIKPVYADKHKDGWGYPQGIEFTLTLHDPEKKSATKTVTKMLPIPYSRAQLLPMKKLSERLGSALKS